MKQDLEKKIATLLKDINNFEPGRPLNKFISYAVFPNFKNLSPGQRIDFDYSLTVLVGPNGTGKTSILHALYGMPSGKTTAKYWFSTALDAISEGHGLGPQRYFYGHWFSKEYKTVETRKSRVTSDRSPEYWEPTKATKGDGMIDVPLLSDDEIFDGRSKDRWNPVARDVVFLNFKEQLSAYDKYMYFGREPGLPTLKSKQDRIRKESQHLKIIAEGDLKRYSYYNYNAVGENRMLTADELLWVGRILGRDYISARLIKHRFFGGELPDSGLSVIFKKNGIGYSEAQAGSGEVSIVSTVVEILKAKANSLILLDEPEVSLHPTAQRKLLEFLLEQIKKNHHQIVISTHSPEFVRGLPEKAIKLMVESNEKFIVRQNVSPNEAFYSLGSPRNDRLVIYVEDELAKVIVELAIRDLPLAENDIIDVEVYPGGAETIICTLGPVLMRQTIGVQLVLLDGDKKPLKLMQDPTEVLPKDDSMLDGFIYDCLGINPKLTVDGSAGNSDSRKKIEANRKFMSWYRDKVRFLPLICPESWVLMAKDSATQYATSKDAKNAMIQLLNNKAQYDKDADEINTIAKYEINQGKDNLIIYLDELRNILKPFVQKLNV